MIYIILGLMALFILSIFCSFEAKKRREWEELRAYQEYLKKKYMRKQDVK